LTEAAIANNRLSLVLAVFEVALDLLWCSTTQRQGHVDGALT